MMSQPLWLLAELTYRCPLQCPYCSNPLEFARGRFRNELDTEDWCRVFREAKALGVLQLGLSGGEPLLRADLERLVAAAHEVGLYTSLITSAYRLTKDRLAALRRSGLDHVQISIQAADEELSNYIAGTASYRDKLAAYRWTKELGFPLTVNVVLHRKNLHQVRDLILLAESLGAERIELANTQFYGWAFHNRDALMPTRAQLDEGWRVVQEERARLGTKLEIVWVLPDYHEQYPKPCMGGWARSYMTVTPAGEVWPCHAAGRITTLKFANVREHSLEWIWHHSDAFTAFRGDAWMPEPCRSCPRKTVDFGGCRCQAFLIAGDAGVTDPVCSLSPHRHLVDDAVAEVERTAAVDAGEWLYRAAPNSRALAAPPRWGGRAAAARGWGPSRGARAPPRPGSPSCCGSPGWRGAATRRCAPSQAACAARPTSRAVCCTGRASCSSTSRRRGSIPGCDARCGSSSGTCARSEERRVGKECRSRWAPYH